MRLLVLAMSLVSLPLEVSAEDKSRGYVVSDLSTKSVTVELVPVNSDPVKSNKEKTGSTGPRQCIFLTGVFPHERTRNAQIHGFELQRQEVSATNRKSLAKAKWTDVKLIATIRILADHEIQEEKLGKGQRNNVTTMPLPKLKSGKWDPEVVMHPRLKKPKNELQLFRYVDFFVKPGKKYRYRVRLISFTDGAEQKTQNEFSKPTKFTPLKKAK